MISPAPRPLRIQISHHQRWGLFLLPLRIPLWVASAPKSSRSLPARSRRYMEVLESRFAVVAATTTVNEVYADRTSSIPTGNDQKLTANEYSEFGSLFDPFQDYQHGSGASESPLSDKVNFLCSFGGKILPRPGNGRLRYVGGETRILSIRKNLLWKDLMQRTLIICNQPHTIRYQLLNEDLDALIFVSSDKDINNMMEEYYGLEKSDGSQRLHIFLIPLNESENCFIDTRCLQSSSEYQFIAAVNNMVDPSPKNLLW